MSEFFDAAAAIAEGQRVAMQQGRIHLMLEVNRWAQRNVAEIGPTAWIELMRIIAPPEAPKDTP